MSCIMVITLRLCIISWPFLEKFHTSGAEWLEKMSFVCVKIIDYPLWYCSNCSNTKLQVGVLLLLVATTQKQDVWDRLALYWCKAELLLSMFCVLELTDIFSCIYNFINLWIFQPANANLFLKLLNLLQARAALYYNLAWLVILGLIT